MNKKLLLFLFSAFLFIYSSAQKSPKRELRGAWITTHFGLDWPTSSQTPAQQRAALVSILDQHKATGMNVIYFQVRNQCDALYPSSIEPWSSTLTGVQGKDPGWDPLQFAIDETHKRGMELHAWLNPYRAVATASQLSSFVPSHVAKQHPEWLLNNGSTITLNPGIPAVRNYIMSVITDITNRYDVDGIHFDDYFYPPAPIYDDATYNADPKGFPATTTGRGDWRRDNINIFIQDLYSTLSSLKPWVKFGVSPSGIYRSSTNPAIGSNTSAGANQHYSSVYADTKKWLQQAWVDYIAPQVYWYMGQLGSDYNVLIPWWNNQSTNGRHIYIGQAIYKVNDAAQGAAWLNRSQIPNQMRMNREVTYQNIYGEIAFRTAFLRSNPLNVRDSIRLNIYKRPALLPTMPWKDNTPPLAPTDLVAEKQPNNAYLLNWTKPAATSNELDKVRQFVVYRSESATIDLTDTANLLFITPTDVTTYTDNTAQANKTYFYTITSVDRLYNESSPSNVTDYLPPSINCPATQYLTVNTSCSAAVPDYRSLATVSDDVTAKEEIQITQLPAAGSILNGAGSHEITLTATDKSGKSASCTFTVITEDKMAPVITPNNSWITNGSTTKVATDNGYCYYTATDKFDISAVDNCSNPVTYSYTLKTNGVTSAPFSGSSLQGVVFPKGTTHIDWTVSDNAGNKATYSYNVEVVDEEAPVITNVSTDPSVLLVPNHKMVEVHVSYNVSDNCGTVTTSLSITSNEDGLADTKGGKKQPDYKVVDDHNILLRAERTGSGNGRIYTILITAKDAAGNISTQTVTVLVPHDHSDVTTTSTMMKGDKVMEVQEGLHVKTLPNPSTTEFTLITSSNSNATIQLRVMDNLNRVVEIRKGVAANGSITIGKNYAPGLYYVVAVQGNKKQSFKLIKQPK